MTVLITMAGMGSRFSRAGYTIPKYKVLARGRSLFEWSMNSLQRFYGQKFIFATLADEDNEWLLAMAKGMGIKDSLVHTRENLSRGQAETAFDALSVVTQQEEIWIYNIDTYVAYGMSPLDMASYDGCVPVFPSKNPSMSFVHYDAFGRVDEVAEKRVISHWATVGMYGFRSAELYKDLYRASYERAGVAEVMGERYIAPMYEIMLNKNLSLAAPKLMREAVHVLGTPTEVQVFDPAALPPTGNTEQGRRAK